jgi:hypothetical protein
VIPFLLITVIVVSSALAVTGIVRRRKHPHTPATFGDTCTKHQLVKMIPGGPERLVWVYGVHRTKGNACDGATHQRGSGWW